MKQVKHDHKLLKLVQKNHEDEAKALLTTGRKKSTLGRSTLKKSTESLSVENLLDVSKPEKLSHIDVNFRDETNGYTALMYAVSNGNVELTTILLHYSADVNVQDKKGNTSLHLAVFNSQSKIVNLLLSRHAKVNTANNDGNTPLHTACQHYGIADKFLLAKLLQTNPDVTAKNKDGAMPVDLAAQYDKQEAVSMLLDHEPELLKSHWAFHEAAIRGHTGVLQLMLDYGIDPNIADKATGTTALHEACRYLRYDAAKLLMTYGADPTIADINDETPAAVLSAYPVEKIDKFLKLFQEGGTMARLRPKYKELPSEEKKRSRRMVENNNEDTNDSSAVTYNEMTQQQLHAASAAPTRTTTTYLKWIDPPVENILADVTMPDFSVEGDPEATDEIELLVEEALVSGDNVYKLVPQGDGLPSKVIFSNVTMLEAGMYTITVRSMANVDIEVKATITVEKRVVPPADLDLMFDELEKMLQF